jgi:hypothetical protein
MKFAVDAWAPEYGAAAEPAALAPSELPTDVGFEVGEEAWAPRSVPAGVEPPASLLFVDGVRRIEARVWVETTAVGSGNGAEAADVRAGVCASFAAGAVRCDLQEPRATIVATEVRRVLLCLAGTDADDIDTRHGRFRLTPIAGDDPDLLPTALLSKMGELEVALAQQSAADHPGEPVVVDGPLSQHRHLPAAVGYVKSLHRSYGPPVVLATVAQLQPGERTPVFVVGERVGRYSWYVRLPGATGHALAGVVRCEAATDLSRDQVVALADRITAALPSFASRAHKDPRAPQNLYPVAGLERELRHRLGDQPLMYRALLRAAAAGTTPATART